MKNTWKDFFSNYENAIIAWFIIVAVVVLGFYFGVDEGIIGAVVVLVGLAGSAFSAFITWIALVPVAGPLIAKVLELPFIWLINGIGYLASLVAIKRGYSKDVLSYRSITVALIIGITIGYVLGKLI